VIIDLLRNSILLFALIFVYGALNFRPNETKLIKNIVAGLLIGFFTIMIMMSPWQYETGTNGSIFYDTRSVILSVAATFFSPITSLIAMVAAAIYRIIVGGDGAIAGVLSIITATGIGMLWRVLRRKISKINIFIEFFLLGVVVHIVVIACQLTLPWEKAIVVIPAIALPYLILYPLVGAILAIAIKNQIDRLEASDKIRQSELLLKASLESPSNLIMCSLDRNYCHLTYNEMHVHFMKNEFGADVSIHSNFLEDIHDDKAYNYLKDKFDRVLQNDSIQLVYECKRIAGIKYVEVSINPIVDEHGKVIGLTMFGQDITDKRRKEDEILHISYHDFLTNLYNRRYFSETIQSLKGLDLPLTFIIADINGLKLTNDAFGHYFGDELIILISKTFLKQFRKNDIICRSGGDEFIIAMKNSTKQDALVIIEKIKNSISAIVFHGISISVSFGVATMTELGKDVETMKLAEVEMYRNKLFESTSDRSETIKAILSTLYVKNPREESHSRRVSEICSLMGEHLKMSMDDIKQLKVMGNLHDIGKIAIDESVLNKPGKLTPEEWVLIRRHPEIGYRILAASTDYAEMAEDILCHHERWDGFGYPKGIKGEEIPLRSRIIALADAFDAMTEERTYRAPLSQNEAIEEIRKNAGTQFDPYLAMEFIKMITSNFENKAQ